jgi:hypothetical protein
MNRVLRTLNTTTSGAKKMSKVQDTLSTKSLSEETNTVLRTLNTTTLDVKKMSKAGLSDDTIISMMKKTNSTYHLTTDDVRDLEKAHVSSVVINYMIST